MGFMYVDEPVNPGPASSSDLHPAATGNDTPENTSGTPAAMILSLV